MKKTNNEKIEKSAEFEEFLLKRNPSASFAKKYIAYINSPLVKRTTKNIANVDSIFKVDDVETLKAIYKKVKINPNNVRLHNVYSGIISAYIKFVQGVELRRMVSKE